MRGKKEYDVNVSDLTLRESKGAGVWGRKVASIHLDNVSVENSATCGVLVECTKRSTMKNCNVSHSKYSGLCVGLKTTALGLMKIEGKGTTINKNCTYGKCDDYVLKARNSFSLTIAFKSR